MDQEHRYPALTALLTAREPCDVTRVCCRVEMLIRSILILLDLSHRVLGGRGMGRRAESATRYSRDRTEARPTAMHRLEIPAYRKHHLHLRKLAYRVENGAVQIVQAVYQRSHGDVDQGFVG